MKPPACRGDRVRFHVVGIADVGDPAALRLALSSARFGRRVVDAERGSDALDLDVHHLVEVRIHESASSGEAASR